MKILQFLFVFLCIPLLGRGQNLAVHPVSNDYQKPTDPLVLEKLEKWQDQKFGIIIHWGLYASAARHEWVQNREKMPKEEYRKYFEVFNNFLCFFNYTTPIHF